MLSILLGNFEVEDFIFDGEADTAMAMAFLVAYVILGAFWGCDASICTPVAHAFPPATTQHNVRNRSGHRDAQPPHRHRLARL
jgi:hypothetical protein